MSVAAGKVYEARGIHGFSSDGVTRDLTGIFNPLWHHDLEGDIQRGLNRVKGIQVPTKH